MSEQQFIEKLVAALQTLRSEDRQEIVSDMKEYFANGRADGKTDQEIASGLGAPEEIARLMKEAYTEIPPVQQLVPSTGKFTRVAISADNSVIEILPSIDEEAHVDLRDHSSDHQLHVEVVNGTLEIRVTQKRKFLFFQFHSKTPTLSVQLPRQTFEKVDVVSDNGSVKCREVQAVQLVMKSDNGRIHGERLTAEDMHFYSDNGRVTLRHSESQKMHLETDNGRIEVEDVRATYSRFKTDNGRIHLRRVESRIEAETDNGRIYAFTEAFRHDMQLVTDNGSIEVNVLEIPSDAVIRTERDSGKAKIFGEKARERKFGEGRVIISLKTDNGQIEVKQGAS